MIGAGGSWLLKGKLGGIFGALTNLFGKKKDKTPSYDKEHEVPALKSSICTGEQTAGFLNLETNKYRDVMLIKSPADLELFKRTYGVDELKKIY